MIGAAVYPLVIEGVGTFEVRRRNLRAEIDIYLEYALLTKGQEQMPSWLRDLCEMVGSLKVLIRTGPTGWNIDEMDPQDPTTFDTLLKVYQAIRDAEARFRQKPADPQGGSETASQVS